MDEQHPDRLSRETPVLPTIKVPAASMGDRGRTNGRENFSLCLLFPILNYIYNNTHTGNNNNIKYKDYGEKTMAQRYGANTKGQDSSREHRQAPERRDETQDFPRDGKVLGGLTI